MADLQTAVGVVQERLAAVDESLQDAREALRAARAAERAQGISPQRPSPRAQELQEAVSDLRKEQATLRQQLEGIASGISDRPLPVEPVHAHLRHRASPITQADTVRGRLLRVWSAASASVMLAALGVLLLAGHSGLIAPVMWIAVAMIAIEAILRRRFLSLLTAALITGVFILLLYALWLIITGNLRVGIGALLIVAALYMAVQTAREGIRTR